jgi:hypothetical protein
MELSLQLFCYISKHFGTKLNLKDSPNLTLSMEGTHILVTGASDGMCKRVCEAFVREE